MELRPATVYTFCMETIDTLANVEITEKTKDEVVETAMGSNIKVNGISPLDIETLVNRGLDAAEKRFEQIQGRESTQDEVIESVKGSLRGFCAEVLSSEVPNGMCETIYSSKGFELDPGIKSITNDEFFKTQDTVRKDLIIMHYFFETEVRRLNPTRYNKVSAEEVDIVEEAVLDTHKNYNHVLREYKKDNIKGPGRVSMQELAQWHARSILGEDFAKDKERRKQVNTMIAEAISFRSKSENGTEPLYKRTSIPDALLIDDKGAAVGAIEVKAYDPREVSDLVKQLEKNNSEIAYAKSLGVQGITSLVSRPGVAKIDVIQYDDDEENTGVGMVLGPNIEGIREFVRIAKGIPQKIDVVDPKTAEVTSVYAEPQRYKVVLRFLGDTPRGTLTKLGKIIEDEGIDNIEIQRLPFLTEEVNDLALRYVRRYIHNSDMVRKHGYKTIENCEPDARNIIRALGKSDAWGAVRKLD